MAKEENSPEDLTYLLGNMGIEILSAIDKGAKDFFTIKLFSGIPLSCIELIKKIDDDYILTEKGFHFKKKILDRS